MFVKLALQNGQVAISIRRGMRPIEPAFDALLESFVVLDFELRIGTRTTFCFERNRLSPTAQPSGDSERWPSGAHCARILPYGQLVLNRHYTHDWVLSVIT